MGWLAGADRRRAALPAISAARSCSARSAGANSRRCCCGGVALDLRRRLGDMPGRYEQARRFRNPAHGQPSPRQLSGRDQAMGRDAGSRWWRDRRRMPVLPRRSSRADATGGAPPSLPRNTIEMAAALARLRDRCRPSRSCSIRRACPRTANLTWLLGGTARVGWLNRMTQWKDKAGKDRDGQSRRAVHLSGAAWPPTCWSTRRRHVPVGHDQKQHLELARDIAAKFNLDFGVDLFPLPEPLISAAAPRDHVAA